MLTDREREQALARTIELVEKHKQSEEGDLGWKLVRAWKCFADATPEDFDQYVRLVSEKYGRPFIDLETAIDFAWGTAKTSDEEAMFSQAFRLAHEAPLPVEQLRGRASTTFQMAASLVYHLSVLKKGEPFHIPAEKLAKLLGFSEQNKGDGVRKIIQQMVLRKLILCVDKTYIPGVKGKLYIWVGEGECEAENEMDDIDF